MYTELLSTITYLKPHTAVLTKGDRELLAKAEDDGCITVGKTTYKADDPRLIKRLNGFEVTDFYTSDDWLPVEDYQL